MKLDTNLSDILVSIYHTVTRTHDQTLTDKQHSHTHIHTFTNEYKS